MSMTPPGNSSGPWLATTVLQLLEQRYGRGKIPSIRVIAAHIQQQDADGTRISHGQVHNILSGSAANITDRTRTLLARFLGVPPRDLVPPAERQPAEGSAMSVETLAMRLSSLSPEKLAAIESAIHMVRNLDKPEPDNAEER